MNVKSWKIPLVPCGMPTRKGLIMGLFFLSLSAVLTVAAIITRIAFSKKGHLSLWLFWVSVILFFLGEASAVAALCVFGHCERATLDYCSIENEPLVAITASGVLALFNFFATFFSALDEP